MNKETKAHLRKILLRIEESSRKILATRGYLSGANRLKLLEELVKEQVQDEDSGHPTRALR